MGYRGKLVARQQARQLRRTGLPLGEIAARLGVSKSSVSLWVRDVEFTPVRQVTRGRRRDPNALQRRKQGEIERLWRRQGRSGSCRSASSWSRGSRCTRGRVPSGRQRRVREQRPSDGGVLLLLWLRPSSRSTSHSAGRVYLHQGLDLAATIAFWSELTGIPASQFVKPYRAVPDHRSASPSMCMVASESSTVAARPPKHHGARRRATWRRCHSGVAQSAERRPVKAMVASSSLAPGAPVRS